MGPKLGEIVIEVKDVSKAFEKRLLIDKLSFTDPELIHIIEQLLIFELCNTHLTFDTFDY